MTIEPAGAGAEILFARRGALGWATLNRPSALNALSLPMIRLLDRQLGLWAEDPAVGAVVIDSADQRSFSAGGDVRAIYDEIAEARRQGRSPSLPGPLGRDFFRAEYRLNHRIHHFPKPFIALVDGIAMGGGVGISIHGSHRVVTERAVFAMPETGIGLVPDVGAGWFLPRFPGEIGTYLALTGARCAAADCRFIGYATHYVPAARLPALTADLAAEFADDLGRAPPGAELSGAVAAAVDAVLAAHAGDLGPAPLAALQPMINEAFGADTVEAIGDRLRALGGAWADETLARMERMSPASLKVTLHHLRIACGMPYDQVAVREYRLSQACAARPDFYEGVRAVLIARDHSPRWNPTALDAVNVAEIERYFDEPKGGDLVFDGSSAAPVVG